MPTPKRPLIPELSLYRLTAQEPDIVLRERAGRLYRVVQRNIRLFAGLLQVSSEDVPRANQEHGNNATSSEYKVGAKHGAMLHFFVPLDRDHLKETADWLLGTDLVSLQVNRYEQELPSDMGKAPDYASHETVIQIFPAPEYNVEDGVLPNVAYAAAHKDENGPRLDAINTETVIGVLTLIADQRQAELG
jgi:hypothetical protein